MSRAYVKVGVRVLVIMAILSLFVYALISRSETLGTTFATGSGQGGLEMKIDSRAIYNGVLQPKLSWALKNLEPFCDFFFQFFDF